MPLSRMTKANLRVLDCSNFAGHPALSFRKAPGDLSPGVFSFLVDPNKLLVVMAPTSLSSGSPSADYPSGRFAFPALIVLLLIAFIAGGGGSRFGLANLAVQLTAIGVLAFHWSAVATFWRTAPWSLRLLIMASLLLPLLQIVPLPPLVWSSLPGRALVEGSFKQAGVADGWMSLSLAPQRTALALSALVTPLAVLTIGWVIPRDRLILLGWLTVGCGLITLLLGLFQLGDTSNSATLFGSRSPGTMLLGTFANRNSTGILLVFALALAALLPAPRPHPAMLPARLVVCGLLLIAVVLTKSRTALVLAMLPVALGLLRSLWWAFGEYRMDGKGRSKKSQIVAAMLGLVIMAIGTTSLVVAAPGRIGETLERFEAKDDPRRYIWDDASYTAMRYWPAGSGMGTFDEVFQVDESLENLTRRTAGRAHNDFLEMAIESGLAGLAMVALWIVLVGALSWQSRGSSQRWTAWAGSAFLVAITLQSITDYPLRNQTILAFAALGLLILARIAADQGRARR